MKCENPDCKVPEEDCSLMGCDAYMGISPIDLRQKVQAVVSNVDFLFRGLFPQETRCCIGLLDTQIHNAQGGTEVCDMDTAIVLKEIRTLMRNYLPC